MMKKLYDMENLNSFILILIYDDDQENHLFGWTVSSKVRHTVGN